MVIYSQSVGRDRDEPEKTETEDARPGKRENR
jgi:hypothetical protein